METTVAEKPTKPAPPPKPQYLVDAKANYDAKLKEFADKREELIASRNVYKEANARFKQEKQAEPAAA